MLGKIAAGFALVIMIALQLQNIATDTSDKAILFADNVESAVDCASEGAEIALCSPELMDTDFTDDPKTPTTLRALKSDLSYYLEEGSVLAVENGADTYYFQVDKIHYHKVDFKIIGRETFTLLKKDIWEFSMGKTSVQMELVDIVGRKVHLTFSPKSI